LTKACNVCPVCAAPLRLGYIGFVVFGDAADKFFLWSVATFGKFVPCPEKLEVLLGLEHMPAGKVSHPYCCANDLGGEVSMFVVVWFAKGEEADDLCNKFVQQKVKFSPRLVGVGAALCHVGDGLFSHDTTPASLARLWRHGLRRSP
jgi:hypothetical protein